MTNLRRILLPLLALCLWLTSCRPDTTSVEIVIQPYAASTTPFATPSPTIPPPQSSVGPSPTRTPITYKIIYQQDGFAIRQAFLGWNVIWRWKDFPMPSRRIKNTVPDLGLGKKMTCETSSDTSTPCAQTVSLPGQNEYTLRLANVKGGSALLTKNGKLLWTGITNGADSYAILTSKSIGNELAFDYAKSNWGNKDEALWMTTSILLTNEKNVTLIPDAFAPNAVDGRLIYFREKLKKYVLIFDGQEVGERYDDVFNLLCCWHGPAINIASDGKIIDFFARKVDGWYHVQAGYLTGEQLK